MLPGFKVLFKSVNLMGL